MTQAKATLEASKHEYLSIELADEEQVVIGAGKEAESKASERPDYDLGAILPLDQLEDEEHIVEMLKLREIYRHLSNAADPGDEAANVISGIVVKMV